MGIRFGMAQVSVQALNQLRRLNMLQLFGYVVHLVPGKIELVDQENLPQAVLAYHLQGMGSTPVR